MLVQPCLGVVVGQSNSGVEWDLGDKVTVRYRKREITGDVRSVSITLNADGKETVRAKLEAEFATG